MLLSQRYLKADDELVGEKSLREQLAQRQSAIDYLFDKKSYWKEVTNFLAGYLEEIDWAPEKNRHKRRHLI